MPLDPDAETLLAMMRAAGRPPMETLTPDEARQSFSAGRAAVQPDPQDVAEVRDFSCSGCRIGRSRQVSLILRHASGSLGR